MFGVPSVVIRVREIWDLIKGTVRRVGADNVPRLAASIAFYAMFSLPSLFVIVITTAGALYDRHAAEERLLEQVQHLLGDEGVRTIAMIIERAGESSAGGTMARILGSLALVFGAAGAFVELQDALNTMWGARPNRRRSGLLGIVFKRVLSFGMVLGIGFLLLVSLVLSAALSAFGDALARRLSSDVTGGLVRLLDLGMSLAVITFLIGLIFKVLPDRKIPWRKIWVGALVTSALFVAAKFLIGFYLGTADVGSAYGAAGSLVILMIWVYVSCMIVLVGAEFTQTYAETRARRTLWDFPPEEEALAEDRARHAAEAEAEGGLPLADPPSERG